MDPQREEKAVPLPGTPSEFDYFEVETRWATWFVSTTMARHIETALDRRRAPSWVVFVDVVGSRIRCRTDAIVSIVENTAEQRARYRERNRRMKQERDADGVWDE